MPRDEALSVTVDDVLYRSADGRFSVVAATREDNDERIVLVGDLRESTSGETLKVHGRSEDHRQYGKRFRVESFTPVTPTTTAGMARYLGSGLITGVGSEIAQRLVAKFGDKTLEIISNQSARLQEVSGIGPSRATAIATAVRSRLLEAERMSFLHSLGLGPAAARRIIEKYGAETPQVVREDPYRLAEQVAGVGFRTADAMAGQLGYARDDPRRAAGAVVHLLGKAADEGHSFLTRTGVQEGARELDVPSERVPAALDALALRGMVMLDDDRVYAPPLYRAERTVARKLRELSSPRVRPKGTDHAVEQARPEWFAEAQATALNATFDTGLLVITGGPGTGKTTTTLAIVRAHKALDRRVLLCAPTGRAAKRLSDTTGLDAQTLHRLLEWNPATGTFARDDKSPLEADMVLLDEASMLDVQLAERLLVALPRAATLVLIGDADQLPPVSPGPVLSELIESRACPVVRLSQVFRQAQQSAIVRGAHAILAGRAPEPSPSGVRGDGDLFIIRSSDPHAIRARLTSTLERIRHAYNLDPVRDVQVLTPMRRGPLGTEALNELLQEHLNPAPADRSEGATPWRFRPGDKVMQLRNDYEREVWNGDLGEVSRIDAGITFVQMGTRAVSYEPDALDALSLAYASTIHKVQGSEFPAIVLVLHTAHHMLLSRPLVYTALTRARKLAVVLCDERALTRAIGNTQQRAVNTHLKARLATPPST